MDKHEAELWKRFDELIARADKMFASAPAWTTLTYTYMTNTTADPAPKAGYTEGFDDGWNAHEATVPRVKG